MPFHVSVGRCTAMAKGDREDVVCLLYSCTGGKRVNSFTAVMSLDNDQ